MLTESQLTESQAHAGIILVCLPHPQCGKCWGGQQKWGLTWDPPCVAVLQKTTHTLAMGPLGCVHRSLPKMKEDRSAHTLGHECSE